uniref:Uncharacterized protein n=1 Tax=virus sp. ctEQ64 TaxID=2825809 RepID=A0A8S5RKF8_9VIRU|nr:MAG TPA: hypothetical protein [virus sp. ctEQ64]
MSPKSLLPSVSRYFFSGVDYTFSIINTLTMVVVEGYSYFL